MITLKLKKPIPNKLPKLITRFKGETVYHYTFSNNDVKVKESLLEIIRRIEK